MKLALICTEKLPSPSIRGGAIQIMIDGVVPILSKDHDVTVYSITDPALPRQGTVNGVKYIRFPASTYIRDVAASLSKHSYDVVHVFNRPKNVPRYKAATPNSKLVVSLHNDMFNPKKLTDKEGIDALHAVEKVMTVSDFIGSTVTKRFPWAKDKVETVYSGFDSSRYVVAGSREAAAIRSRLRRKYGATGKKVILFVGRLSVKKGPHLLIEAMRDVLAKHKDAMLVIVGGKWFSDNTIDDYGKQLHSLAKPFGNKVVFTKFVSAKDIPDYYLMADVFVCTSQWQEPLARVHYEAMAAGVPIITTNRGGNAEVIKHGANGLVVNDYKNSKAFSNMIDYVLSNPDAAKKMAQNGRKFVESDFTFNHVANRLLRVYKEAYGAVIAARRRRKK